MQHQERPFEAHANQPSFEGDGVGSDDLDHKVKPWEFICWQ